MIRIIAATFLMCTMFLGSNAQAQNQICPTAAAGDNSNKCASTAFVQLTLGSGLPLTNGDLFIGNASNLAIARALSGDCTVTNLGAITCTKTGGTSFAPSATTDATNASNIGSGTLNSARLPTVPITKGGTGQTTASAGFNALAPVGVNPGDIAQWNGTTWTTIPGNTGATGVLQETSSGVASWSSTASAGVSQIDGQTGSFTTSNGVSSTGKSLQLNFTNANTWTAAQTFHGDASFMSGSPWCDVTTQGAVHNSSTDDSAAFQACFTQCLTTRSTGACTVFVPPQLQSYCIKNTVSFNTGLTYNGGIILVGGGVQGTVISACGSNANLFYMNNQWAQIKQMTIYGYGSFASDPVFTGTAPTQPVILMGSGCSQCRIQDVYVTGGTAAIELSGACGYVLDNVWASGSYGDGSHVAGYVYEINCGGTIWNSHFDQVYPVLQPAHGITIAAWQASHAYASVGTIVTVTCNSRSAYIQLKTAGTSAGSAPNCSIFGQNITDNTAVWQFVNFGSMACLNLDTGSIETEIIQTDMTCDNDYNLSFTNSYAGTAPTQNSVIRSTPGGAISFDVIVSSTTSHLTMMGVESQYCAVAGCASVLINGVASNINIDSLDCFNGIAYCVEITQPANSITVKGMHASGADTADFSVSAAATGWMLTNSTHATGSGFFYSIGAVAADHYQISGNVCNGASASDAGTGTHKNVVACSGTNP